MAITEIRETLKFSEKLDRFRGIVNLGGNPSISSLSKTLSWPRSEILHFKFIFSSLTNDEIAVLDSATFQINYEVLAAICLCPPITRGPLMKSLGEIHKAGNPFDIIERIMLDNIQKHPLENVTNKYWKEVARYLNDRQIDRYPFNQKAINFINSVGKTGGFSSQSEAQKKWIIGLMKADKNGFDLSDIFINQGLERMGLKKDLQIVTAFYQCL